MRVRPIVATTALLGACAKTLPGQERDENRTRCMSSDPGPSITGCTLPILTGSETMAVLAAAFNERGIAYRHKGQYGRAIKDFNEAIELNPEYADAFKNRCWCLAIAGPLRPPWQIAINRRPWGRTTKARSAAAHWCISR